MNAWAEFRAYVASAPGPKVVVVQDTSKPRVLGSMWGEVGATMYRNLGCVGTITDGGVRDLGEMTAAGFKAIARRLCVGHGYGTILRWNCDVDGRGNTVAFPIKRYDEQELLNSHLPQDNARQAFGRGLAILGEDLIVGGSSPFTISVYDLNTSEVVRTINLTMDVRNTIHGLEVWPF